MRRFIVIGHKAATAADFKLDDLAGGAGRLDVLLRCINSAFFLSHDLRRDVEVLLILQGPPGPARTIRLVGSELRYLNPDERSTGALIRNALMRETTSEERSTPGIYVSTRTFQDVLGLLGSETKLVYLKEDGEDIRSAEMPGDVTFVLSDHMDLTPDEEELLLRYSPQVLRLGPISYHADHCVTIVHNELDRRSP
ncbi:MAG: tRNA (pseudouridine(54)-N(1))-methyltransferase TrmY [Methanomassiliicoccales archaeon]|nr:tRNA (pseudouridine(54)-N(1))-methyltransferase TrmY [Methanomassiliicoccales archaeon]